MNCKHKLISCLVSLFLLWGFSDLHAADTNAPLIDLIDNASIELSQRLVAFEKSLEDIVIYPKQTWPWIVDSLMQENPSYTYLKQIVKQKMPKLSDICGEVIDQGNLERLLRRFLTLAKKINTKTPDRDLHQALDGISRIQDELDAISVPAIINPADFSYEFFDLISVVTGYHKPVETTTEVHHFAEDSYINYQLYLDNVIENILARSAEHIETRISTESASLLKKIVREVKFLEDLSCALDLTTPLSELSASLNSIARIKGRILTYTRELGTDIITHHRTRDALISEEHKRHITDIFMALTRCLKETTRYLDNILIEFFITGERCWLQCDRRKHAPLLARCYDKRSLYKTQLTGVFLIIGLIGSGCGLIYALTDGSPKRIAAIFGFISLALVAIIRTIHSYFLADRTSKTLPENLSSAFRRLEALNPNTIINAIEAQAPATPRRHPSYLTTLVPYAQPIVPQGPILERIRAHIPIAHPVSFEDSAAGVSFYDPPEAGDNTGQTSPFSISCSYSESKSDTDAAENNGRTSVSPTDLPAQIRQATHRVIQIGEVMNLANTELRTTLSKFDPQGSSDDTPS